MPTTTDHADQSRPPNGDALLRLEEVTKSFGPGPPAVDRVSFSVDRGELVVLLGESGCGKTTTLKMINRLVEPDSGKIWLEGEEVHARPAVEVRRSIGYVFQASGLFPHFSVAENVGITLELLGWEEKRRRQRIRELLELIQLPPDTFADRAPAELSGGQRQRVGFARALAASPHLLLLDEPFGALDPVTRNALQEQFREIQRSLNLAALVVTHDMTEALILADRVLIMRDGKILQQGNPRQVFNAPDNEFVDNLMQTPRRQAAQLEKLLESR